MKTQQRPSLLALSALLLCTRVHQTDSSSPSPSSSASSSELRGNRSHGDTIPGQENNSDSTLISERSGPSPGAGVSPVCAYRVIEGGIWGQLCFRHTLLGYKCHKDDCRTRVSFGNLVVNILINGSVLLQWTHEEDSNKTRGAKNILDVDSGANLTRSVTVFGERRHRRGGYEMSCWWNGSYTQFECASVHFGSDCRDFLLSELHENIPYRICLRSLSRSDAEPRDCVEFTLPPSGMQDIVIAMTTVGGAICVMLVIICLLVAYITENIMSPATQHAYSYRTHSHH